MSVRWLRLCHRMRMTVFGRVLMAIGAIAILSSLAAVVYIATGSFPVGADSGRGILDTIAAYTRERSVETADDAIAVPTLTDAKQIALGAQHYNKMCRGCHLAPGMPTNEMRVGMDPRPPKLASREHPNAREDFWIIKHGIKMTAMPAWGLTHSDAQIWALVAFLQKLPGMTQEQYASLTSSEGGAEEP